MRSRFIQPIFWALVVIFIAMVAMIFLDKYLVGPVIFPFWGVIFVLGVVLIFLTIRERLVGTLRTSLLLMGSAAAGLPFFVVLHNLISGLLGAEEPVFFLLAVIVCPLAFLVGTISSIVLMIKNRSPREQAFGA